MRKWMIVLGICQLSQLYAFPCYITLVKDNCWLDYNVSMNVIDVMGDKPLMTITIPKGKTWTRQAFVCQPNQSVRLVATFSPPIWEADAGKVYRGKRFWTFPDEITPNQSAWNLNLCYPRHFAGTPLTPADTGKCACDASVIPKIEPK